MNEPRAMGIRGTHAPKQVAAYCRVSTDKEDQAGSFESQCRFFRRYIDSNPDWELFGIFADEGVTGTNTLKRREFNRMIECAKEGKIDLILTKEISRFARNTLDSIYYTRDLKRHGVGVLFLNDNINTLDGDAELRLAILSSIAQEESRKTSERVKWGQKRRMEQGVVFGRDLLGYDVQDGRLVVNEDGAKVVRLIFQKFLEEGKGTHVIARELAEAGISPLRGGTWQASGVLRILRNEKYCGDLVQKKTYTPDFLTHEKKRNEGQEDLVVIRGHHEPIILREAFEEANRVLDERSHFQTGMAKHSKRHPFSGKIKCACCGASYVARYKKRMDGSVRRLWRCYNAVLHGKQKTGLNSGKNGCSAPSIREEELLTALYQALERLVDLEREVKGPVQSALLKAVRFHDASEPGLPAVPLDADFFARVESAVDGLLFGGRRLPNHVLEPSWEPWDPVGLYQEQTFLFRQLLEQVTVSEDGGLQITFRGLPACRVDLEDGS